MNTTQCRNCGSNDVYEQEVRAQGPNGLNLLPVKISLLNPAKFRLEVCGSCGLTEWFVPERYLAQVKDGFPAKSPN